jgi:hypothetical protein
MTSWFNRWTHNTEWKVASLCTICAIASTIFASEMISRTDEAPGITISENFMLFARPSTTRRESLMKFAPPPAQVATAPTAVEVDTTPIGSISPFPPRVEKPALPATQVRELAGFSIRGAFDGKILVQGPAGFELVGPGDKLTDGGSVLSVKYERGRWIVITETGSITSAPQN